MAVTREQALQEQAERWAEGYTPKPTTIERLHDEMRQSFDDKAFFVGRLPEDVTTYADFGCADGSFLLHLHRKLPPGQPRQFIGYDSNKGYIMDALRLHGVDSWPARFTHHLVEFERYMVERRRQRAWGHKTCLILSSVIHEVLSVTGMTMPSFWQMVRSFGADYIVVRDMAVDGSLYSEPVYPAVRNAIMDHEATRDVLLKDPKVRSLENMAQAVQVLLKYPWRDSPSEIHEDYLPMSAETMLNHLTIGSGYELRHYEHSMLPYLHRKWMGDLGVSVTVPTHVKFILRRKNRE